MTGLGHLQSDFVSNSSGSSRYNDVFHSQVLSAKGIKNPRSFGCVLGAVGIAACLLCGRGTDDLVGD